MPFNLAEKNDKMGQRRRGIHISNCPITRSYPPNTNIKSGPISMKAKDEEIMHYDLVAKDFDKDNTDNSMGEPKNKRQYKFSHIEYLFTQLLEQSFKNVILIICTKCFCEATSLQINPNLILNGSSS